MKLIMKGCIMGVIIKGFIFFYGDDERCSLYDGDYDGCSLYDGDYDGDYDGCLLYGGHYGGYSQIYTHLAFILSFYSILLEFSITEFNSF